MTFEEQKPTNYLEGQNDVKEREIVEEYKVVIDEDVKETVTSGEHPKATTMNNETNIIQQTEHFKNQLQGILRTSSHLQKDNLMSM